MSAFAAVPDDALGFAAGTLTTIAFVPQLLRIVKTRSAHDISWWMFGILIAGIALWLWYGIRVNALPVIIANAVTLVLTVAIVLLKRRYHPGIKPTRAAPKPRGDRISRE
jgi:MtN3 and saliva related transmembrane protein